MRTHPLFLLLYPRKVGVLLKPVGKKINSVRCLVLVPIPHMQIAFFDRHWMCKRYVFSLTHANLKKGAGK